MYYGAMGWDPNKGVPTRGKLAELDLFWLDAFLKAKRRGE
jgi:aldehyde:ferredoxin oxidoreductase